MTTCLGKSCSFGLPRVPFVNCCQFYVFSYFPFGFEGRMCDLIVSVPDHCLSFYSAPSKDESPLPIPIKLEEMVILVYKTCTYPSLSNLYL